jgi:DNA-binding CsgD family transcriptional regulator
MLVGRAAELAACVRLDPNRPVALIGEAGIGKTALLRAAVSESGRHAYEGVGLATLSWMSYLPVARALAESPPPGDHAAVAAWVLDHVTGGVLVLDDLHWADGDTLALLPLLVGRIPVMAAIRRGDRGSARAESQVRQAGFELLPVHGLEDTHAAVLVRLTRAHVTADDVRRIVRRAGGNPLLLEEFARDDDDTLRLSLGARLHRCSPEAQEAMALLGLLGRPAEPALLPPSVDELVEAGLVRSDGELAPRHALLAEVATGELAPGARRCLHARLARLVTEPGEAARHHAAAGERRRARASALEAAQLATRPGERAHHLALAASCTCGPAGDELRLEAAAALVTAGEYAAAVELLDGVETERAESQAYVELYRARAYFGVSEMERSRRAIERGMRLVEGSGTAAEVRVRIEREHLPLWDWTHSSVARSQEVLRLATAANVEVTRAEVRLGIARYLDRDPEAITPLRAGLAAALAEDDHQLACEAAEFLCGALQAFGHPDEAHDCAERMERWCRDRGLRAHELTLRWLRCRVSYLSRGADPSTIADLQTVLDNPGAGASCDQVAADLALALADVGRLDEASRCLGGIPGLTPAGRLSAQISGAEVAWSAGRPTAALEHVAQLDLDGLADTSLEYAAEARCVLGWSQIDLGRPPKPFVPPPMARMAAGFVPELAGLSRLLDPRGARAAGQLLEQAASLHDGHLVRWQLRCEWGAAEAARRAGDRSGARTRLLAIEARAQDLGMRPLVNRIRRSLRQVGVSRSERRGPSKQAITPRQREVLQLVAAGHSSAEIACRLGLSRATVESLIRSAMTNLGARTRIHAASLAKQTG